MNCDIFFKLFAKIFCSGMMLRGWLENYDISSICFSILVKPADIKNLAKKNIFIGFDFEHYLRKNPAKF